MFCVCVRLEGATPGTITLCNNVVIDVYNGSRTGSDVDECVNRSLDRNQDRHSQNTPPHHHHKFSGASSWAVLVLTVVSFYLSRCGLQTGSPAPPSVTPSPALPPPAHGEDAEDQATAVPHLREGRGRGRGQDAE